MTAKQARRLGSLIAFVGLFFATKWYGWRLGLVILLCLWGNNLSERWRRGSPSGTGL